MHQTSGQVARRGEKKKKKANLERCDCKTLVKNQSPGKVVAFPNEEESGLDVSHTAPAPTVPLPLPSPVPKCSLLGWGCSRRTVSESAGTPASLPKAAAGSGTGKREGADTG